MIERPEMIERLRAVLSSTPQTSTELLTRAGLAAGRRLGTLAAVALRALRDQGVVRSHGEYPHMTWSLVEAGDSDLETVELPGLDATVTFATTTHRTEIGTRRTTLVATVALGPSWPEGTTPPPRWSTSLLDAQVAAGGLAGARSNALTRAEAHLRALRARKTLLPLPTETVMTDRENPLLNPSKNRTDFLSYLASIPKGARQDSAAAWLVKRAIAQTAEEAVRWLDELVIRSVLDEVVGVASDGSKIVRYRQHEAAPVPPPAPSVSPLASEPEPEPTAPSNDAAAPSEPACARCLDLEYRVERSEETREASEREAARLRQERDFARGEVCGLETRLTEAESKARTLEGQARDLAELKAEAEIYYEALCRIAPDLRGTSAGHLADGACEEVARLRQKARPPHQGEQFATSIAGWLVSLSEEAWQQVQQARTDLAKARDLREQSHQLEQSALDALDRLVGAPAAPQAAPVAPQAPELVPDPIPLGPAPAAPPPLAKAAPVGDQGGPMIERVRRFFEQNPAEEISAPELGPRLGCSAKHVSPSLSTLFRAGLLDKPRTGFYRLARKSRRAA